VFLSSHLSSCLNILQSEGVGTVRFQNHHTYDDDGGLSFDAGSSDDERELTVSQEDNLPASLYPHLASFILKSLVSEKVNYL
jgi:hypothetical protein